MFCSSCGQEIPDGSVACPNCGAKVGGGAGQTVTGFQEKLYIPVSGVPAEYQPISMWGYFGYSLLFAIPLVGFILKLVFAFGGTPNKNLKNFARAQFCMWIVGAVLFLLFGLRILLAWLSYAFY